MYKNGGYLEVVDACAKLLMMRAVAEVKALPNYPTSGEVCIFRHAESYTRSIWLVHITTSLNSGSLHMLDMTPLPMPFIQLYLAYLEGTYTLCVVILVNMYFIILNIHCTYTICAYTKSTKCTLACSTVSRKEHTTAQTRELHRTKMVLPKVLEQGSLLQTRRYLLSI